MRRPAALRIVARVAAAVWALSSHTQAREPSAAQAILSSSPDPSRVGSRDRTLSVARDIMKAARFCTLVTIGEKSQPQARIIDPLEPDPSLTVYFATNPKSRKVSEIRKDSRVTLLYFDAARMGYVTLIGRAVEVTGAEKPAHRKSDWNAFFAQDKPDTYTLYRIVPTRVEVVSSKDGLSGDPASWRPEIVELKN